MFKLTLILILLSFPAIAQLQIQSGSYSELDLAFDKETKIVTGYYNNATGWDENIKAPLFTCTFYLEGILKDSILNIKTYFPLSPTEDIVLGGMHVSAIDKIKIKLAEDHGGCWNVQHFAENPVDFSLDKPQPWTQIRFAIKDTIYLYSEPNDSKKPASYIVKGDIVYVEKFLDGWAFCTYFGKKTTKGWLKAIELNQPNK